jgi:serine/threonine-protein kinase
MSDVLYGLDAAHEALDDRGVPLRVVHRDVSPPNILVGTNGVARVVDFGIAKAAGRLQITGAGQVKGKLWYISPEQAVAGQVDRRTDIYSASVVLWECLTGQRLFEGDKDPEILEKVQAGAAMPPSGIVPTIPQAIDRITMRGLSKNPKDRWSSAKEMGLALRSAAEVATPEEVGMWVQELAKGTLERRSDTLEYILQLEAHQEAEAAEQAALEQAASGTTDVAVVTTQRRPAKSRTLFIVGIVAVLVALIAVGFVLLRQQSKGDIPNDGTSTSSR